MQKFTIFTVFLAIIVLSLVLELGKEDSSKNEDLLTNVLKEDTYGEQEFKSDSEMLLAIEHNRPSAKEEVKSEPVKEEQKVEEKKDEPVIVEKIVEPSFLEALIKDVNPAFTFKTEPFSGKVFQLLDISEVSLESATQGNLKNGEALEGVIYELKALDEVMAAEVYQLIKQKTIEYNEISVNETNKYGDGSFYINHVQKPNEVFLTIRIKNKIYAFAYSRPSHENIVKLISLLTFVSS